MPAFCFYSKEDNGNTCENATPVPYANCVCTACQEIHQVRRSGMPLQGERSQAFLVLPEKRKEQIQTLKAFLEAGNKRLTANRIAKRAAKDPAELEREARRKDARARVEARYKPQRAAKRVAWQQGMREAIAEKEASGESQKGVIKLTPEEIHNLKLDLNFNLNSTAANVTTWASYTDEQREARGEAIGEGRDLWWNSLSPAEQAAHMQPAHEGHTRWWNSLSAGEQVEFMLPAHEGRAVWWADLQTDPIKYQEWHDHFMAATWRNVDWRICTRRSVV